MARRLLAALLLPITLFQLAGCTKRSWIATEELGPEERQQIRVIRTVEGEEVALDEMPTPLIRNDSLHGSVDGERYSVAVADIEEYNVERTDTWQSIRLALLPIVIVGAVAMVAFFKAMSEWGSGDGR